MPRGKRISSGLLLYRKTARGTEVFLAHPGGPFFRNKNDGWWTIPKGTVDTDEDHLEAAKREFEEETGVKLNVKSEFIPLGNIVQKGGKVVHCWAVEGNVEENYVLKSNTFPMEWPPRSGKMIEVPEMDKAEFFTMDEARVKIMESQLPLLDRLEEYVKGTE